MKIPVYVSYYTDACVFFKYVSKTRIADPYGICIFSCIS